MILGTAPEERWVGEEWFAIVRESFGRGPGWKSVPFEQHVAISEDGNTAWFDERLRRESGTELRTAGVLRREEEGWKVVLLDNVFPVPNENAAELARKIEETRFPTPVAIDDGSDAARMLIEFHRAGNAAELEPYLDAIAPDAVLLGTDAGERFTPAQMRGFLNPAFAAGPGRDAHLVVLRVTESRDGGFAWFESIVDRPARCEMRTTGLLRRVEARWRIVFYNRAFAVPNELIDHVVRGGHYTKPCPPAKLREDFALLRRTLEEEHPARYDYVDESTFARVGDEIAAAIDAPMTPLEFERLITPVVALVQCVHTRIDRSGAHERAARRHGTYLPVDPQVIDDRLWVRLCYVDETMPAERDTLAPGAEILAINGRGAAAMLEHLLARIPADGGIRTRRLAEVNDWFPFLYATHVESPERYTLRVRPRGSEEVREVSVPALSYAEWLVKSREAGRPLAPGLLPALETRILPEEDLAILTLRTFGPPDLGACATAQQEFFARVEADGIGNLIVDLRANGGGDPYLGSLLVSFLAEEPFAYLQCAEHEVPFDLLGVARLLGKQKPDRHRFRGRAFVLIGGHNSSTAGHVLAWLKQQGRVVMIGETSGATWICNDNSRDLVLPNSGLRLRIARTTYRTAVTGMPAGVGIAPHHEVLLTVEEMRAGRDPVLEFARELARQGE